MPCLYTIYKANTTNTFIHYQQLLDTVGENFNGFKNKCFCNVLYNEIETCSKINRDSQK